MECPICGFHGKDQKVLAWHYGISHKKVFSLLNDWCVQNNFKDEDLLVNTNVFYPIKSFFTLFLSVDKTIQARNET